MMRPASISFRKSGNINIITLNARKVVAIVFPGCRVRQSLYVLENSRIEFGDLYRIESP